MLVKEPRRDQPIATVIAGARHDDHALTANAVHEGHHEAGHLPAGDFHELERLDAKLLTGADIRLPQRRGRYRFDLAPRDGGPGHVTSRVSPGAVCRRAAAEPSRNANSIRPLLPISATSSFGAASS